MLVTTGYLSLLARRVLYISSEKKNWTCQRQAQTRKDKKSVPLERTNVNHDSAAQASSPQLKARTSNPKTNQNHASKTQAQKSSRQDVDALRTLFFPEGPTDRHICLASASIGSEPTKKGVK